VLFADDFIVDEITGCWNWQRSLNTHGYAQVAVPNSSPRGVHRMTYEAIFGPVPEGAVLDHKCDNRRCVNPAHVQVTTIGENVRRGERAKLDWLKVREIRRLHAAGGMTHAMIGGLFGVSASAITMIINNRRWRTEDDPAQAA